MQVVASRPKYLNKNDVPKDVLEHETKIIKDGILDDKETMSKNVDVNKIVNSKVNNWYGENVLNEQQFVIVEHDSKDSKLKVADVVSKKGKELGIDDLKIKEFKLLI